MVEAAENVADRYGLTRDEIDAFAPPFWAGS
jgi:acetyl-CoA acetyltransferase